MGSEKASTLLFPECIWSLDENENIWIWIRKTPALTSMLRSLSPSHFCYPFQSRICNNNSQHNILHIHYLSRFPDKLAKKPLLFFPFRSWGKTHRDWGTFLRLQWQSWNLSQSLVERHTLSLPVLGHVHPIKVKHTSIYISTGQEAVQPCQPFL